MARYLVPIYKLNELTKKINHIRNKGAEVHFDVINPSVAVEAEALGENTVIECAEIEVEGRYHIDGWSFVGTIEHASPENIIRLADFNFENRIPERYRTAGRDCEHCHIRRDRNDTYLVYNENEDEFKQVGRTCLRGYTNGLNAETCAELASVMAEIARINSNTRNRDFSDIDMYGRGYVRYSMNTARKQAYAYVQANGYTAGVTGKAFSKELSENPNLQQATDAEIQAVTDYLNSAQESDYIRNTKAVWNKEYYSFRDAGFITSAVSSYFRERDRQAQLAAQQQQNAQTEYAGQVGDEVQFTVSEARVIYWRTGGPSFNASEYPVFRIVSNDGKIFVWATASNPDLDAGDILKGKIKKLIERPNGEKQTEVTRCKLISKAPSRSFRLNFVDED